MELARPTQAGACQGRPACSSGHQQHLRRRSQRATQAGRCSRPSAVPQPGTEGLFNDSFKAILNQARLCLVVYAALCERGLTPIRVQALERQGPDALTSGPAPVREERCPPRLATLPSPDPSH